MNPQVTNILLGISPIFIGGIIALINGDGINKLTEGAESWIRKKQLIVSKKKGWFFNIVIHPILWLIVRFANWTDSFAHRGLKNGVRITLSLYLIAVWCFLIYAAFVIMLAIVIGGIILYVIFSMLSHSDNNFKKGFDTGRNIFKSKNTNQTMDYVGLKGKKMYSGTNWFNEELKGRVDDEGNIYKGTNWFNEDKIGRIDDDGNIYEGTTWLNEEKVGRIDDEGNIIKGSNWFNEEKTGRIDDDGNIHKGTNWFNEEKEGRIGD